MAGVMAPVGGDAGAQVRPVYPRRWYVMTILCVLFATSMVDRYVLTLLVQPLKHDLGLSDVQLGLLMGVAFALLYSIIGLPAAHLIDRARRTAILAGGVTVWSVSTILSAFADSYVHLLLLRAGVAVGEAVLTPAAVSLIADMFARRERALPTSIYMATSGIMGTGAFAIGGLALAGATQLTAGTGFAPWRATLILVGLPGVVLAAVILLTVREPRRIVEPLAPVQSSESGWSYLVKTWRLYLPFLLGVGVLNIFTMGMVTWFPTFLVRTHGVTAAEAGYLFSVAGVPAGLIGSLLWPWIASRMEAVGRTDAPMWLLAITAALIIPLAWLLPLVSSAAAAAVLVGVIIVVISTNTTLPLLIVQAVGPGWMRGRLTALVLLAYGLVGLGLGPAIVAFVGERHATPDWNLGHALAVTASGAALIAAVCFVLARSAYARALAGQLPADSSPIHQELV